MSKETPNHRAEHRPVTVELLRGFIEMYSRFHEATSPSLLSEDTRRSRRTLLQTSLLAYAVTWGGIVPTKLSFLGIEFAPSNLAFLYMGLALVLAYLFRSFWWRADLEFSNSRIRRQTEAILLRLNSIQFFRDLKEVPELPSELISELEKIDFDPESTDPYRSAVMGTNFKARFFELRLPQVVATGAILSCVYFAAVSRMAV